jgi:hypothetical protein
MIADSTNERLKLASTYIKEAIYAFDQKKIAITEVNNAVVADDAKSVLMVAMVLLLFLVFLRSPNCSKIITAPSIGNFPL